MQFVSWRNLPNLILQYLASCAIAFAMTSDPAHAEDRKPRAEDRAAIASCLEAVGKAQRHQAQIASTTDGDPPQTEKLDPAKWLRKAAERAGADETSCIGVVSSPCQDTFEGRSTAGSADCNRRELAVWDERLNAAYKVWIEGCGEQKVCAARKKFARVWLAARNARCDLPSLEEDGGTSAIPMTAYCLMDATARQAIWLEGHR